MEFMKHVSILSQVLQSSGPSAKFCITFYNASIYSAQSIISCCDSYDCGIAWL